VREKKKACRDADKLPLGFDRGWDLDPAATLTDTTWDPIPSLDDHLAMEPQIPHSTNENHLGLFGIGNGLQCASEDRFLGCSFDSLMREHQSCFDRFSYMPAYESLGCDRQPMCGAPVQPGPSHQTLTSGALCGQSANENLSEVSPFSSIVLPASRPVRADLNSNNLRSLDSYTPPTHAQHGTRTPSAFFTPTPSSSSIRYNPILIRREHSKLGAARSKEGGYGPAHQHVCSVCSCQFVRARDLTRHFRLHTGERPYLCGGCNERFIRVDARKRHWNSHPECTSGSLDFP